ncbi:MAG TPA: hypothetical protein VGG75_01215 [Trebonia sp.]|jgi:hypothetical protein
MSSESAETYLRLFAEDRLRHLADGALTAAECDASVGAVAAAFQATGVLDRARADEIASQFSVAIAARSTETSLSPHQPRRTRAAVLRGSGRVSPRHPPRPGMPAGPAPGLAAQAGAAAGASGRTRVVPVGAVLRTQGGGQAGDSTTASEDIYLLAYVAIPGRAWLDVAARTSEPPARRPASPPSGRNAGARKARPSTFAGGGMTATDNDGQRYTLGFSGGGGTWYLGRLTLSPPPPPALEWLDISCGGRTVRADLRAQPPEAECHVRKPDATAGEAYLLRRAEAILFRPARAATEATGLASIVPALRAVGALPARSEVPGQVAALLKRLAVPGPAIAAPGGLPARWAAVLAARASAARDPATRDSAAGSSAAPGGGGDEGGAADDHALTAAHVAAVLPAADGIAVTLTGLITRAAEGTVIFGALQERPPDSALEERPPDSRWQERISMWLADETGAWHSVTVSGWSSNARGCTFTADVVPPLTPTTTTTTIEFYVTSPETEVRAAIPVTWWIT